MEKEKFEERVLENVREIVSLTRGKVHRGALALDSIGKETVTSMVRLGYLEKEGVRNNPAYTLVVNMTPEEIALVAAPDVREHRRTLRKKYYAEKKRIYENGDITRFSAQELWDELKGRGYCISDNRLLRIDEIVL